MNDIELQPADLPAGEKNAEATTASIQAAIDRAHANGGGRVILASGTWISGTVFLRSQVELHLARGCILQASEALADYTPVSNHADNKDQTRYHLIVADDCQQVALTGPGVIDGAGEAFWTPCEDEHDRPYGIFRFKVRGDHTSRPSPLVELTHCRELVVDGVTIRNSPGWTLHVYDCDHASVRNVTIRNNRFGPNTDGIGINASRDVRVAHCDVDTGDDAYIIKSTHPDLCCERITVGNCIAASNCAAFGLGADAAGTIRDVVFNNCIANRSLRLIQVEQWYAGTMERAIFSNITGRTYPDEGVTCERPIYIDIQQWMRTDSRLGAIRDLVFHNILCETRGRIVMTAQDGSRIENVTLDNVRLRVPEIEDPKENVPRSRSMQLSNFNPETRAARALVVADNVHGLTLRGVAVDWPEHPTIPMQAICQRNCSGMRIDSPELTGCTVKPDAENH